MSCGFECLRCCGRDRAHPAGTAHYKDGQQMNEIRIDCTFFGTIGELSMREAGALLASLVEFASYPELYTDALPSAPQSVSCILQNIIEVNMDTGRTGAA